MAPGGGDGRRNGEGQQQANGNNNNNNSNAKAKHGCVCGFPVCACAGAAAVASAASSADMDRVAAAQTEGQIGAVNDESWIAVDLSDDLSGDGGGADPGVAIEDRPVFRTEKIKGILLHPYRYTYTSSSISEFTSPAGARTHKVCIDRPASPPVVTRRRRIYSQQQQLHCQSPTPTTR
jgi:hypothetical protein